MNDALPRSSPTPEYLQEVHDRNVQKLRSKQLWRDVNNAVLVYGMARLIRNTDRLNMLDWGIEANKLLDTLRAMDPDAYTHQVMHPDPSKPAGVMPVTLVNQTDQHIQATATFTDAGLKVVVSSPPPPAPGTTEGM